MTAPTPSCDVVIVTHTRPDLLQDCMERFREQTMPHKVIVVNDGADQETADLVEQHHPEAHLLPLDPGRGFATAVNAGVRAGDGHVVVVMNDDVLPEPTFLEELLRPLAGDPEVGMVAALMLRPDGRIDSFGLEVDRTLATFPRLWGRPANEAEAAGDENLLGPAGAAAAYRRDAWEAVGGFDQRLVIYYEDTDIAVRLKAAGWRCAAAPKARGVHLGSATLGHRSSNQRYRLGFSRAFLLRKYRVLRDPLRAARTLTAEAGSVGWQLVKARDGSGLRGRAAGWRAARAERRVPGEMVNAAITLREGVARRRSFGR